MGHVVEYVGQSHEDQAGTGVHFHIVCKAGGEDNETGDDGNKGILQRYIDGFSQLSAFLPNVATKNRHSADPQAQRKECLSQST